MIESDRNKGRDVFEQMKIKLSKANIKNRDSWIILLHNELSSNINNELDIIYQQRQVPWKIIALNLIIVSSFTIVYQFILQSNNFIKLLYSIGISFIILFITSVATIILHRINFNSLYHRIVSNTQKELRNKITGIDTVIESFIIKNCSEYIIEINQIKNSNTTQKYLSIWQYSLLWITSILSIVLILLQYVA